MHIRVLGAGLAGCEAALYLAGRGYAVELWEQKPHKFSPAHKNADFAELVCSNSLKADRLDSASGLDIMQKLTALNEQGTSIILITHDNHLAQMARRIVTIQDGRIISDEAGKGGLDE